MAGFGPLMHHHDPQKKTTTNRVKNASRKIRTFVRSAGDSGAISTPAGTLRFSTSIIITTAAKTTASYTMNDQFKITYVVFDIVDPPY
jgi:hypothetical protein